MNDEQFDDLLHEMRNEPATPEQIAAATERVGRTLDALNACSGFQSDWREYRAGTLAEARRLLLEDHLSRCAACRESLIEPKPKVTVMPAPKPRVKWARWAIAAGVVLGGVYLASDRIDAALAPGGPRATVVATSGVVYRLPSGAVATGATLGENEAIRTAAGGRAVLRLADGSQVELNQRTEVAIHAAWSGNTIRLNRGDVMVEAARQRRGRLRVATRDTVASVKGTMFEVSSGTAGSVVSVVEGSVAVSQPGSERLLAKGESAATNPALERDVRDSVSWSKDAEKYYAILGELQALEKQIAATPSMRTEARLLRRLPEGVAVYIAIPNLTGSVRQALFQFQQETKKSAVLEEWWTSPDGEEMKTLLGRVQSVTPMLGEEMVFALVRSPQGSRNPYYPLFVAEVQEGREETLRGAMDRIGKGDEFKYRVESKLLKITDDAAHFSAVGAGISAEFAAEIEKRYQRGAGWLAAVDLSRLSAEVRDTPQARAAGLANVRYLFLEQGAGGRADDTQAVLSFREARTGIASWLAPAGSSGSTEYISQDAVVVFSASTKDPKQAYEELVALLGAGFTDHLSAFEAEAGVSVGGDIAGALGTDFTIAVEQPTVPIPGWIAAIEVVQPAVLDSTLRRLVERSNQKLTFTEETANGRTWNAISSGPLSLYWTYDRGYMIASMDRALAIRAIGLRESGLSLVRSALFRDQFPANGGMHQSGFVWINAAAAAGLANLATNPGLKQLLSGRDPVLVFIDAGTEQIRAASRTRLTSLLLDMMLASGPETETGARTTRR